MDGTIVTEQDREDLLTLLRMRFGAVDPEMESLIRAITDATQIDHLILVAANAARPEHVWQEVKQPGFRVVGQHFNPLNAEYPTTKGAST
ncbi:MAG: hypothetical protein OWQ57_02765 [Sulfobacillus sp.]|nr:hypothetical protein [Sulfobacillus sp.]